MKMDEITMKTQSAEVDKDLKAHLEPDAKDLMSEETQSMFKKHGGYLFSNVVN